MYDKLLVVHKGEGRLKKFGKIALKTVLAVGAGLVTGGGYSTLGLAELDSLAKRAVGREQGNIKQRMEEKSDIANKTIAEATTAVLSTDDAQKHARALEIASSRISAQQQENASKARRSKRNKRNIGLGIGLLAGATGGILNNVLTGDLPDMSADNTGVDQPNVQPGEAQPSGADKPSGSGIGEGLKLGAGIDSTAPEVPQLSPEQATALEKSLIEEGLATGDVSKIPGLVDGYDPFANADKLAETIENDPGKHLWNEQRNVFGFSEAQQVQMWEGKGGVSTLTQLHDAGVDIKLFGDVNGLQITGDTYGFAGAVEIPRG